MINELILFFCPNTASIHSNHGNGALRELFLTVFIAVYDTLAEYEFTTLINSGAKVTIPIISTMPQVSVLKWTHKSALKDRDKFNSMDGALIQQLLSYVDHMYYRGLRNRYTGYGQINTRELVVQLYINDGKIGPDNLKENEIRMKESYYATEAVKVLFDLLRIAFNLTFETGQFTQSCEKWDKKFTKENIW